MPHLSTIKGRILFVFALMGAALSVVIWVALRGAANYALFGAILLAFALYAAAAMYALRSIAGPLARTSGVLRLLAEGDLMVQLPAVDRRDEIGQVADALKAIKAALSAARQPQAATATQELEERRQAAVLGHVAAFEAGIGASLEALGTAAARVNDTSGSMLATAETTRAESSAAASGLEAASLNVQIASAATAELSSSITEIGRQAGESSRMSEQAVNQANRTDQTVRDLAEAASKIGDIVKIIHDIASQTNLLALNATIEAARAGEAGRGFAVVASEVKQLAAQTAKATEEIAGQVTAIQDSTGNAVMAIKSIGEAITAISGVAATISTAVEEQSAAAQEITRNVQEAERSTGTLSTTIGGINRAAGDAEAVVAQARAASEELDKHAHALRGDIDRFLGEIRATWRSEPGIHRPAAGAAA